MEKKNERPGQLESVHRTNTKYIRSKFSVCRYLDLGTPTSTLSRPYRLAPKARKLERRRTA